MATPNDKHAPMTPLRFRFSLLLLLISLGLLSPLRAQLIGGDDGQDQQHAELSFQLQSDQPVPVGETLTLVVKAEPESGWHMYSTRKEGNIAYKPTKIELSKNAAKAFELVEVREEGELKDEYDELMEGQIREFRSPPTYYFTYKVLKKTAKLAGSLSYQICTDAGKCVFGNKEFSVDVQVKGGEQALASADSPEETPADGDANDGTAPSAGDDADTADAAGGSAEASGKDMPLGPDSEASAESSDNEGPTPPEKDQGGVLAMFFVSLGAGLVALLTPCVFPMIPMTVSFFTKRSKSRQAGLRNALLYVGSIVTLFVLIGLLITGVFGSETLYQISINPWVNVAFFLLLVIFALSFFGMFNIELPNSWTNKMDQMSDRGGILGIFFMAMTLVIASFSCTGPLVGGALVTASQSGNMLGPVIIMLGFSLGFGLPFGLFAAFPGWMNAMPKAGGWMNSVKVVLGFLELALSFKFLSIADLRWGTHFLDRDIFLALWVVIFALLGLYLLGKIRLPHDTPLEKISVPRMLIAMISFAFVVYLLPGMFGAPLSRLSGYLPPEKHSLGVTAVNVHRGGGGGQGAPKYTGGENCPPDRRYLDAFGDNTPQNFCAFYDLNEARKYAKKVDKPLFVDFTGVTCANCREMEHYVWPNPKVTKLLNEKYVMVSLFVDSDIELDEPVKTEDGSTIESLGRKWQHYQKKHFGTISQPFYVAMDPNTMETLTDPVGYTREVSEYVSFLETGLKRYKKRSDQGQEALAKR